MTNEQAQKVLDELQRVRPEKLNGEAKRLFEAIMKIADERDKKKQDGEIIIHKYKFIEKCNDNLFLYEEVKQKYKICFTRYDLGLVKEIVKPPKSDLKVEKVKI